MLQMRRPHQGRIRRDSVRDMLQGCQGRRDAGEIEMSILKSIVRLAGTIFMVFLTLYGTFAFIHDYAPASGLALKVTTASGRLWLSLEVLSFFVVYIGSLTILRFWGPEKVKRYLSK
jgi:hypothetical protein